MKINSKIFCHCLLIFSSLLFSQNDSIKTESLESLNQKLTKITSSFDSANINDSVNKQSISQRLSLKTTTSETKLKLIEQLDSIDNEIELRKILTKKEIDSIRTKSSGIPVIIFDDTLFNIFSRIGPFGPEERSISITKKIESIINKNELDTTELRVEEDQSNLNITHKDQILFSITKLDAIWLGKDQEFLADDYLLKIKKIVKEYNIYSGIWEIAQRILMLLIVIVVFYFGIKYLNKGLTKFNVFILNKGKRFVHGIKIKDYELLSKDREIQLIEWLLNSLKWTIIVVAFYLAIPVVFSIFPATESIATTLFGYVLDPVTDFAAALVSYIPNLITILVIVVITFYFVKLLKFLAEEVRTGKLEIPGFYTEWAIPTYNLLRIIIFAFSFVVIFPYLPGSDSNIFRGVSVFFGLLISLGSSSAIGNIIAGLVITYMRAFKIGDRVKIGETVGEVIEKTMLVTRVRTIKNEEVTIPNMSILNGTTINYSASAQTLGLILNSSVTIGYDVPWRKVHELLLNAANKTGDVKKEPAPFVLQTSLDDFYISYQINAYTDKAEKAAKIYSELHGHIIDEFNEANVEILSPHYRAARDGNMVTIPPEHLPPDYNAPGFNVNLKKEN